MHRNYLTLTHLILMEGSSDDFQVKTEKQLIRKLQKLGKQIEWYKVTKADKINWMSNIL